MASEDNIRAIWDTLSPAVEASIRTSGGFTPVGGIVDRTGTVRAVVPSGEDSLALLEREMRAVVADGEVVAAVRATNATVQIAGAPEPAIGILLRYDDASGVSQTNFMAYALRDGQVVYGELHAQDGEHELFGRPGGPREPTPEAAPEPASGTVEVLLTWVEALPPRAERADLYVPNALTFEGQPWPQNVAMALLVDRLLGRGLYPDGFEERPAGRQYRFTATPPRELG